MILNKHTNQIMITHTQQYINIQDMLLAIINMITKSTPTDDRNNIGIDFTNFPNVNIHNVQWAIQELGYEDTEIDVNGWEMDFYQRFDKKPSYLPILECDGCGVDFTLIVRGSNDDKKSYKPLENNPKYKDRIEHGNNLLKHYISIIDNENKQTGMTEE